MPKTPLFDPRQPYTTQRSLTGVRIIQKGAVFDFGKKFVERVPGYKAPKEQVSAPEPVAKPKIRGRLPTKSEETGYLDESPELVAAKNKLAAFSETIPAEIKQARRENAAAAAAEDLAD